MVMTTHSESILAEVTGSPRIGEYPNTLLDGAWDIWGRVRRQFVADEHADVPGVANGATVGGSRSALSKNPAPLEVVHAQLRGSPVAGEIGRWRPTTLLAREVWDGRFRTLGEVIDSAQAMLAIIDLEPGAAAPAVPVPRLPAGLTQGSLAWAADYAQRDALAAKFENANWNRQSSSGDGNASGLPWPPKVADVLDARKVSRRAIEFRVPKGGKRAELQPPDLVNQFTEGSMRFFGYSLMFASDFPLKRAPGNNAWQIVLQSHGGSGSPPWAFDILEGRLQITGGWPIKSYRKDTGYELQSNVWYDFVVGCQYSSDPKKGSLSVWVNDEELLDEFRPAAGTKYPTANGYLKAGLYTDPNFPGGAVFGSGLRVASGYGAARGIGG